MPATTTLLKKATDSPQTTEKKGTAPEAESSSEGARHVYLSDVIRRIEALASIGRAGPFPPFPPEFKESETVLYVTLDFRMH